MDDAGNYVLSTLGHTWILDIDGTIVKHNGYKIDGYDTFLAGAKDFLDHIPQNDMIIFLTSRTEEYKEMTERFLAENEVRYDYIIYKVPYGERIVINDRKPSGLQTAVALNLERDNFQGAVGYFGLSMDKVTES
ncbi:MAG: HAD family acid phosphatase [Lachnospiraceae bacterium]|nr:HAD family acid phosphatase [Lachnospiraceae bacterium]